jgi:hypothetical protein
MAPVSGVAMVLTAYAAGPAQAAITPTAATAMAIRPRRRGTTAMARPTATQATKMRIRRAGSQFGLRFNST